MSPSPFYALDIRASMNSPFMCQQSHYFFFQYKRKKKLMEVKFVRNIFSRHVRNIGIRIGDGKIHFFLIRLVTFNYLVKRKIHSNCYVLETITYYIYFYFLVWFGVLNGAFDFNLLDYYGEFSFVVFFFLVVWYKVIWRNWVFFLSFF